MLKTSIRSMWGGFMLAILILLAGCTPSVSSPAPLRIAVLPILDSLPLYVAETQGYFAERGLEVEFVAVASASERDQLLQAGQVDGIITDLVALALYNKESVSMMGVRYAMVPTADHAQFRVLTSADSGIESVADLAGVAIGISEGTVIDYVTAQLLLAEGVAADDIQIIAVPKIPDRMALLNSGELQAATLPEPLASLVMQQGALVVVDDTQYPEFSCSIFAFRKTLLDAQPESIRAFLAAVDQASAAINADKTLWDALLIEQKLIPAPLLGAYELPDYPAAQVPTEMQFTDALRWLQAEGWLSSEPVYSDVVTDRFLEN